MLVIPLLLLQLAHAGTAKDPGKKHISPTAVIGPTPAKPLYHKNCRLLDVKRPYRMSSADSNDPYWCTPEEAKYHNCVVRQVEEAPARTVQYSSHQKTVPAKDNGGAIIGWIIVAAAGFVLYKSTGPHEPLF